MVTKHHGLIALVIFGIITILYTGKFRFKSLTSISQYYTQDDPTQRKPVYILKHRDFSNRSVGVLNINQLTMQSNSTKRKPAKTDNPKTSTTSPGTGINKKFKLHNEELLKRIHKLGAAFINAQSQLASKIRSTSMPMKKANINEQRSFPFTKLNYLKSGRVSHFHLISTAATYTDTTPLLDYTSTVTIPSTKSYILNEQKTQPAQNNKTTLQDTSYDKNKNDIQISSTVIKSTTEMLQQRTSQNLPSSTMKTMSLAEGKSNQEQEQQALQNHQRSVQQHSSNYQQQGYKSNKLQQGEKPQLTQAHTKHTPSVTTTSRPAERYKMKSIKLHHWKGQPDKFELFKYTIIPNVEHGRVNKAQRVNTQCKNLIVQHQSQHQLVIVSNIIQFYDQKHRSKLYIYGGRADTNTAPNDAEIEARWWEILNTVQANLNNKIVKNILLLLESETLADKLQAIDFTNSHKLVLISLNQVLKVGTTFEIGSRCFPNEIIAVCNQDVLFGKGWDKLDFEYMKNNKLMYSLTRHISKSKCYDTTNSANVASCDPGYATLESADAWIFHAKQTLTVDKFSELKNTLFNAYAMENIIAWIFKFKFHYKVTNPCKTLYLHHEHCVPIRNIRITVPDYQRNHFAPPPTYILT